MGGFADFGIGRQHSDYVMNQRTFMKKAMIKKQFSARLSFDDENEYVPVSNKNTKNRKAYAKISADDEEESNANRKKKRKMNLKVPGDAYSPLQSNTYVEEEEKND